MEEKKTNLFGSMFGDLKKPCKMCGTPMPSKDMEFCSEKCKEVHEQIRLKKLREQQSGNS